MKKYFLIFLIILPLKVFSCALCAIYDPSVNVGADINIWKDKIVSIGFKWEFSQSFTAKTLEVYDFNQNGKLDPDELKELKNVFDISLSESAYYLHLGSGNLEKFSHEQIIQHVKNRQFSIKDKKIHYDFLLKTDLPADKLLRLTFKDTQGNFSFFINPQNFKINSAEGIAFSNKTNFYASTASIVFTKSATNSLSVGQVESVHKESESFYTQLLYKMAETLKYLLSELKAKLTSVSEGGSIGAWFTLLFFSFAYGAFHALGPGHGKAIVSSYFAANKRRYKDGIKMSLWIGVTHTLSAFLLTLMGYGIVKTTATTLAGKSEYLVTALAGAAIVIIATVLLFRKIFPDKTHDHEAHTCGCSSCSSKKSDAGIVLAVGGIPCPGAVIVFMAIFTVGGVLGGLLSAVFISLGMASVIAVASLLAIGVRNKMESKFVKFAAFFEIVALAVVFILGFLMMAASLFSLDYIS